ncbi:MAG: hypothetical protein LBB29_00815 [Holosporaceae bacterium]|jgi:hypothetical protein|nr:hypothetical protein [Holosporaceae bacterium]
MLQAQISVSIVTGGEYASRRWEGENKKTTSDKILRFSTKYKNISSETAEILSEISLWCSRMS